MSTSSARASCTSLPSASSRLRESDLEGHFRHKDADPSAPEIPESDKNDLLIDPGVPGEPAPEAEGADIQLARAVEVLKSWTYFEKLRGSEPQQQARAPESEAEAPTPAE